MCVPCDPYRCSETSTCSRPCRPYFRVPADADSRPCSACRSDCKGETSDKDLADLLPWFHNDGRILLDVTNSGRRVHRLAETVAGPIASAEVPVRPHRSAADADAGVPPRHFAGPGYTNSRSTNSCYCPTCPTCLCHFPTLLTDFPLVIFQLIYNFFPLSLYLHKFIFVLYSSCADTLARLYIDTDLSLRNCISSRIFISFSLDLCHLTRTLEQHKHTYIYIYQITIILDHMYII